MKSIYVSICVGFSLLVVLFSVSNSCQKRTDEKTDNQAVIEEQIYTEDKTVKTVSELYPAYNAPANIDVDGIQTWASVSYMLWNASEKGLELGHMYSNAPTQHQGKVVNMDFDYKSGFKISVGYNTNHDAWQVYADYLRLHLTDSKNESLSANMTAISTYWFETARDATVANAKWKLGIDLLDLMIARPCYVGKKLVFSPHFGIMGGWIDQKYNVKYTIGSVVPESKNKADSWLIGPKAGLDTKWLFYKGFRMFANLDLSIFYQDFNSKAKQETYNNPATLAANYKNNKGYVNPSCEVFTGLGWGMYFSNRKAHVDLLAGYDFMVFFEQNMMRYLNDMISSRTGASPGNLCLHGLTTTLRFDF